MIKLIRKISDKLTRPDKLYELDGRFYVFVCGPYFYDHKSNTAYSSTFLKNQYRRVSQNYFGVWHRDNEWHETDTPLTPFNGSITLSNEVECGRNEY